MRTHLANTALRVDDWILLDINGERKEQRNIPRRMFKHSRGGTFGETGNLAFFCSVHFWRTESRLVLVFILDPQHQP